MHFAPDEENALCPQCYEAWMKKPKKRCRICGKESNKKDDIMNLNIFTFGSEGVDACLNCRILLSNVIEFLSRWKADLRKEVWKENKKEKKVLLAGLKPDIIGCLASIEINALQLYRDPTDKVLARAEDIKEDVDGLVNLLGYDEAYEKKINFMIGDDEVLRGIRG